MSIRSDRKWAAKQAREDVKGFTTRKAAQTAHVQANTASKLAHGESERARTNTFLQQVGAKESHKLAGEAHLKAAEAHQKAAQALRSTLSGSGAGSLAAQNNALQDAAKHEAAARDHKERASDHAEHAGSEWDEDKHPRDENGKFA